MPLYKDKLYTINPAAQNPQPSEGSYVIPFTGEVFSSYTEYIQRITLYRQRVWTCKSTGKSGLTFEEALASEAKSGSRKQTVPEIFKGPILRLTQHSTLRIDDLVSHIIDSIEKTFVVGEEVTSINERGEVLQCKVIQKIETSDAEAEPQYEVEWIDLYSPSSARGIVPQKAVRRKRSPLSRPILRSWITKVASQGHSKGSPWLVNEKDVARYGLPTSLPQDVVKGIETAKAEARARAEQARARAKEKALAKEAEAIALAKNKGANLPAVFLANAELATKGKPLQDAAAKLDAAQPAAAMEQSSEQMPAAGLAAAPAGELEASEALETSAVAPPIAGTGEDRRGSLDEQAGPLKRARLANGGQDTSVSDGAKPSNGSPSEGGSGQGRFGVMTPPPVGKEGYGLMGGAGEGNQNGPNGQALVVQPEKRGVFDLPRGEDGKHVIPNAFLFSNPPSRPAEKTAGNGPLVAAQQQKAVEKPVPSNVSITPFNETGDGSSPTFSPIPASEPIPAFKDAAVGRTLVSRPVPQQPVVGGQVALMQEVAPGAAAELGCNEEVPVEELDPHASIENLLESLMSQDPGPSYAGNHEADVSALHPPPPAFASAPVPAKPQPSFQASSQAGLQPNQQVMPSASFQHAFPEQGYMMSRQPAPTAAPVAQRSVPFQGGLLNGPQLPQGYTFFPGARPLSPPHIVSGRSPQPWASKVAPGERAQDFVQWPQAGLGGLATQGGTSAFAPVKQLDARANVAAPVAANPRPPNPAATAGNSSDDEVPIGQMGGKPKVKKVKKGEPKTKEGEKEGKPKKKRVRKAKGVNGDVEKGAVLENGMKQGDLPKKKRKIAPKKTEKKEKGQHGSSKEELEDGPVAGGSAASTPDGKRVIKKTQRLLEGEESNLVRLPSIQGSAPSSPKEKAPVKKKKKVQKEGDPEVVRQPKKRQLEPPAEGGLAEPAEEAEKPPLEEETREDDARESTPGPFELTAFRRKRSETTPKKRFDSGNLDVDLDVALSVPIRKKRSQNDAEGQSKPQKKRKTLPLVVQEALQESEPEPEPEPEPEAEAELESFNKDRCTVCRRIQGLDGSELVMCDTCPRSYHLSCLDPPLTTADLPEGDWNCPKCVEKQERERKRLEEMTQRQRDKEERDRARQKEREEREVQREEEKRERESARLEERRQREIRRAAEREAREAEREAEREHKRFLERLDRLEDMRRKKYPVEDTHVERVEVEEKLLAQKAGLDAEQEVPKRPPRPEPQPAERLLTAGGPAAGKVESELFGEILVVWDFLHSFGRRFRCPVTSMHALLQAVANPSGSQLLVNLYVTLFKALVDVGAGTAPGGTQGGIGYETLSRWQRFVDKASWQEVLRRYLSRGDHTLDYQLQEIAEDLGAKLYSDLTPEQHVALLRCLCDDVLDGHVTRDWLESNAEAVSELQKQRLLQEQDEKRQMAERLKLEKDERKAARAARAAKKRAAKKARKEKGLSDTNFNDLSDFSGDSSDLNEDDDAEPDFDFPEEEREYQGDPEDRKAVLAHKQWMQEEEERLGRLRQDWLRRRDQKRKAADRKRQIKKQKAAMRKKHEEDARRRREDAYEKELGKLVLRSVPLGEDRHHQKYWWFSGDRSLLYVEEGGRFGDQESSRWKVYSSKDELDQLLEYFTEKGIRENELKNALLGLYPRMSQYLRKKRLQLGDTDVNETVDAEVEKAQEEQAPPPPEEPDRVPVECNLVPGELLLEAVTIDCGCEDCKKDSDSQPFSPNEWELHCGSRSKKWRSSIRVEVSGSRPTPVGRWLEEKGIQLGVQQEREKSPVPEISPKSEQPDGVELEALENTMTEMQELLESRGGRPSNGWNVWKKSLRQAVSVEQMRPLLLELEDVALSMSVETKGGKRGTNAASPVTAVPAVTPAATAGNDEEERAAEPAPQEEKAGVSEAEDGGAEEKVPEEEASPVDEHIDWRSVSDIEDEAIAEEGGKARRGPDDGTLWRGANLRKAWRAEVSKAKTSARLVYLAYSVHERVEPFLEAVAGRKKARREQAEAEAKRQRSLQERKEPDEGAGNGAVLVKKANEDVGQCYLCGLVGELLMCDGDSCARLAHLECAGLSRVPRGKWHCAHCAARLAGRRPPKDDQLFMPRARSPREDSPAFPTVGKAGRPRTQREDSPGGGRISRFKKESMLAKEPTPPKSAPGRLGKPPKLERGAGRGAKKEEDDEVVFVAPSPPKRSRSGRGAANGALAGLSLLAEVGAKDQDDDAEEDKEAIDLSGSLSKKKRTRMAEDLPEKKKGKQAATAVKSDPEEQVKRKAREEAPRIGTPKSGNLKESNSCSVCHKEGELVHCSGAECATQVHPECVRLRGIPKTAWFCQSCRVKGKGLSWRCQNGRAAQRMVHSQRA